MFSEQAEKFNQERVIETEETINPTTIALATSTFYPSYGEGSLESEDNVRGRLALEFLKRAMRDGYQVVVVDDHSSEAWKKELTSFQAQGAVVEEQIEPGLSASRRQAMEVASSMPGVLVVAESESEKIDIVVSAKKLALPIVNGEADVAVPNRGEAGMGNYPSVQKTTEERSNKRANKIARGVGLLPDDSPDLDWWIGVRFIRNDPSVLGEFLKKRTMEGEGKLWQKSRPGDWSDAMYTPIVSALNKPGGRGVISVDFPYSHPKEQSSIEEGQPHFDEKRRLQSHSVTTNLIEEIRDIVKKPSRLLEFERFDSGKHKIDALFFDERKNAWVKPVVPDIDSFKQVTTYLCEKALAGGKKLSMEDARGKMIDMGVSAPVASRVISVFPQDGFCALEEFSDLSTKRRYIGIIGVSTAEKYPFAPHEVAVVASYI